MHKRATFANVASWGCPHWQHGVGKRRQKLGHELDSDSHCYDPNQILTCTLISERFYVQRLQTFVSLVLIFNTTGVKKGHDVNNYIRTRMYCNNPNPAS